MVDIFEMEGDEATGGDVLTEIKVPSPTTKSGSKKVGRGTRAHGGSTASVGHWVAFGNTEEVLRATVYGLKGRGREGDKPFDHDKGHGWVKPKEGLYHDAIYNKGHHLLLLISSTNGALNDEAMRYLRRLAKTAGEAGDEDKTKYDTSRRHRLSFFEHHARKLSAAAVIGDAQVILKSTTSIRIRAARMQQAPLAQPATPPARAT